MFFLSCFVLFLVILTIQSGALGWLVCWLVMSTHLSFSENHLLWLPDLFPWVVVIKLDFHFLGTYLKLFPPCLLLCLFEHQLSPNPVIQ